MEEGEVEEVVSGVEVEVDERKVEVAWLVGTSTFGVEVEGGSVQSGSGSAPGGWKE